MTSEESVVDISSGRRKKARTMSDPHALGCTPGGPPLLLDEHQRGEGGHSEPGKDIKSRGKAACPLFGETERGGEVAAADASCHTDKPGHHADFIGKALGNQLEDRSVAGAKREHRNNEQSERGGQACSLGHACERERR